MRRIAIAILGVALATPALAQAPNWQQSLQGLVTGNQNQDDALRQAYQRGYQRGRDDESRAMRRADTRPNDRYDNGNQYDNGNRYDNAPGQSTPPAYSR
jgi:Ni/Co efflux regulator RcnB